MWLKVVRLPMRRFSSSSSVTPRISWQPMNTDKGLSGPLALPHLHQHVGAAGDDLGLADAPAAGAMASCTLSA